MTREEKIKGLYNLKEYLVKNPIALEGYKSLPITLIDYAIEAIAQEPCDDCISKQAVLDKAVYTETEEGWSGRTVDVKDIKTLPLVNPQKMGHWIDDTNGIYTDNHDTWECSECGHAQILLEGTPKDNDYNYCPNCGAKMEEEE